MEVGLDLVGPGSSRRRKASMKQKAVESEDDDFALQTKKSKNSAKHKKKIEEVKPSDAKSKRLSRDEKLFNRDLEQAMAKSDNIISLSSAQGDQSITSSSSSRSEEPSGDPLDDSAYIPGNNKHSDSDEDFEPSPPAKKLKKSEDKKVKRKPIKKENVKTAAKSASGVSTVAGTDMLGSGPLPTGSQSQVGQQTVSITNVTPVRRKGVAKWVPPARVGGNASTTKGSAVPPVRSGGAAPAIRVGLSRKAPIKPLHSVQSPLQTRK